MAGELRIDIQAFGRLEHEMQQLDGAATAAAASAKATAIGVARSGEAATRAARGWNRAAKSIMDYAQAGITANVGSAAITRVASALGQLPGAIGADVEDAARAYDRLEREMRQVAGAGQRVA